MKISDEQFARLKDVLLKSDITDNTIDKLIDSVNNEEIDDELLDYYVTPKVTKHDKVIALKDRIFNHGNRITSMPKNVIERLRKNENKLSVFEKLIKRKKEKNNNQVISDEENIENLKVNEDGDVVVAKGFEENIEENVNKESDTVVANQAEENVEENEAIKVKGASPYPWWIMQKDCSLKVPKGMDLNEMQRTNLLGKGLATTLLSVPLIPVVTNFVGLGLMKLNSNLWQKCGFSPNTQDFLHQLNLKINSFLGNKFSFDSGTGYWLDTSGNIINNINGVLNKAHEALGLAASAGAGVGILKGLKKIGKKACSTFKNKDKENVSFNNNYQNNETILEYPEPTIHNPKSVEKDENIKKQIINDINYSYDQIEQNEVKNYDAKMYEAESRLNELEKLNFKTANQRQEYEDLTNLSNNTFIPTISNDDKARYLYNEMERLQNKENLTYEDKERFRILEDEFNKVNSIIEGGRSR